MRMVLPLPQHAHAMHRNDDSKASGSTYLRGFQTYELWMQRNQIQDPKSQ